MLNLKQLKKEYPNKHLKPIVALDEFSYIFPTTGMVFILGHSGSGKSTLLNLIGTLDTPSSGEILFNGTCINNLKETLLDYYRNEYISFIFQDYNLLEDFSVYENLNIASELNHPNSDFLPFADELLKKVRLEGYGHKMPYMLSGGEKQRVAIARALVKNPKIILADEPTGALDEDSEKLVMRTLKELSKHALIILVTHNKSLAVEYADEIIELSNGKVKNGTEKNLISTQEDTTTFLTPYHRKLRKKHIFKIGFNNIKRNKFRFILASVISIIALTLFGISDILQAYNESNTLINSIYDEKITSISLRKEGFLTYPNKEQWYSDFKLTENDILQLEKETGENLLGVYHPPYVDISLKENQGTPTNKASKSYGLFSDKLSGLVELAEKDLCDFNYTLAAGSLPNGKKDEIALSKYIFEVFKLTGYRNYYHKTMEPEYNGDGQISFEKDPIITTEVKTYEDLIGKTIYICQKNFTITGIVDTGFDIGRYSGLSLSDSVATNESLDVMSALLCDEIDYLRNYGDICLGFVGEHKIAEIKNLYPSVIDIKGLNLQIKNNYLSYSTSTIGKYSEMDKHLALTVPIEHTGETHSSLSRPQDTESSHTDIVIENFAIPYFNASTIEYNQLVVPSSVILKTSIIKDGEIFYSDDYFVPNEERCSDINFIISYDDNRDFNQLFGFEIVASFFSPATADSNYYYTKEYPAPDTIFVNDELFNELSMGREGLYTRALSTIPQKKCELKNFMEICENYGTTIKFSVENIISYELAFMGSLFNKISIIASYISITLIFLSMLTSSNYLATTIHQQKRNLSILRSLGARRADIFKIFILQCGFSVLSSFVTSSLLTFIIASIGNTLVKSQFNIMLTLLAPSLRQFLLIFALSFLSIIFGGIIPLKKFLSKTIIDAKNC